MKTLQQQEPRIMLSNGITKSRYRMSREGKSKEHQVISKSKSLPSLLVD